MLRLKSKRFYKSYFCMREKFTFTALSALFALAFVCGCAKDKRVEEPTVADAGALPPPATVVAPEAANAVEVVAAQPAQTAPVAADEKAADAAAPATDKPAEKPAEVAAVPVAEEDPLNATFDEYALGALFTLMSNAAQNPEDTGRLAREVGELYETGVVPTNASFGFGTRWPTLRVFKRVEPDAAIAVFAYQTSADKGNPFAKEKLEAYRLNGADIPALLWKGELKSYVFRRVDARQQPNALELDDATARDFLVDVENSIAGAGKAYAVGALFEKGFSDKPDGLSQVKFYYTDVDLPLAVYCYQRAVAADNSRAKERLAKLAADGANIADLAEKGKARAAEFISGLPILDSESRFTPTQRRLLEQTRALKAETMAKKVEQVAVHRNDGEKLCELGTAFLHGVGAEPPYMRWHLYNTPNGKLEHANSLFDRAYRQACEDATMQPDLALAAFCFTRAAAGRYDGANACVLEMKRMRVDLPALVQAGELKINAIHPSAAKALGIYQDVVAAP